MFKLIRMYLKDALDKIRGNIIDVHAEYPLEKFDVK